MNKPAVIERIDGDFRVEGSEISSPLSRRQRYLVIVLLALAVAARGFIAARSIGSNDARIWEDFAHYITQHGLLQTYRDIQHFNHPPLMGLFSSLALKLSELTHQRFITIFKVPVILADMGAAWLLWLTWRDRGERKAAIVVVLFSFNLISMLISSYHGNTDCVFATLALASAYALSRERWGWAGLALGAAINVKIVPLMLLPVFALTLPSRRALLRFGLALAVCALPFLPVVLRIWPVFYRNVFAYNSMPFQWGIQVLIQSTAGTLPNLSTWLSVHYVPNARFVILSAMLLIGVLQRWNQRLNPFETGALAFSMFLVLLPGFGIQYLAWVVPLLFAANLRAALEFTAYGGVFAFLVYYLFWTGTSPWFSNFGGIFLPPGPLVGAFAWAALVSYCTATFRKLLEPAHVAEHREAGRLQALELP